MHGHGDLIADFDARQVHQGGVKDDALGIAHLRDCFGHDVILCFTGLFGKEAQKYEVESGKEEEGGNSEI